MKLRSRSLLVKYQFKSTALRLSPRFYWAMRRWLKGWGEPELALLPSFADPARPAFDIGAHFGLWTAALRPHFSQIHAFEAMPRLAGVLRDGYRGDDHVHVHDVALSDRNGPAAMRIPIAGLGRGTIEPGNRLQGLKDMSQPIREISVEARQLDAMNLPDPALIKLDIEGHELAVLQGGANMLARARPVLIIEMEDRHAPESRARIMKMLSELGYAALQLPRSRNTIFLPRA
ncbi:MAG TPA: FkbM family methyltransferase [Rhizomicrobium sp.]|nr:FkbM family methyltransferase [Rhizomicrobium sp.]